MTGQDKLSVIFGSPLEKDDDENNIFTIHIGGGLKQNRLDEILRRLCLRLYTEITQINVPRNTLTIWFEKSLDLEVDFRSRGTFVVVINMIKESSLSSLVVFSVFGFPEDTPMSDNDDDENAVFEYTITMYQKQ